MIPKGDSYIIQCKANYFSGIRPADKNAKETVGYKALIRIAKNYFDRNEYDEFAVSFIEGQYFIALWTAHLILEYGQPSSELKAKCLEVIKSHTDNPLAPEIAEQEKVWLENYYSG